MRLSAMLAALLLCACGGPEFSNSTGPVAQASKATIQLAAGKPTYIKVGSVDVAEGGIAVVPITLGGGNGRAVTITWVAQSGTAKAGVDFPNLLSGSQTLKNGTFSVRISVADDNLVNGNRYFTITAKATSGTTGASGSGTVTITDNDQACPDGSVISTAETCPAPAPEPTPEPQPTGDIPSPSLSGHDPIASNFDVSSEFVTAPIPVSAAPDTLGAFRFICDPGQVLADDPIVYPGQPGKSHLHQFYGNTGANANSTYEALRTSGQSTCMSPLNRSAYWIPALLDGNGNVVRPDYVQVYYKRYAANSWQCNDGRVGKACVQQPNGLRWIVGRDMLNLSAPATGRAVFLCDNNTGSFKTLSEALKVCTPGHHVLADIAGPECWDGKRLDSADHRSHVAFMVDSHMGYPMCPTTHPYIIPQFNLGSAWLVVEGEDTSKFRFSSDAMTPDEPAGATFHADLFDAWDQTAKSLWTDNCIGKLLNCSSGILGNGQALKQSYPFSWTATPRLVPVPQ